MKELDKSGDYPSFNCFAEFVQKEACIVCNPIASPLLFSVKSDGRLSKGVKSFSTNTQAEHLNNKTSGGLLTSTPKLPCLVCKEDHLGIAKCPVFASKSMDDKRSFIHLSLVFSLVACAKDTLQKTVIPGTFVGGVVNATPHVCMKRGKGNLRDEVNITPTPTRGQTFQKVHEVLSCTLFHKASATSSIVPVFVSSDKES